MNASTRRGASSLSSVSGSVAGTTSPGGRSNPTRRAVVSILIVTAVTIAVLVAGTFDQSRLSVPSGVPRVEVSSTSVPLGSGVTEPLIDSSNGDVYVLNWGSNNISWLQNSSEQVSGSIPLNGAPYQAVYDRTDNSLFVTTYNTTETGQVTVSLVAVSALNRFIDGTLKIGELWSWVPPSLAVNPGLNLVFVESTPVGGSTRVTAVSGITDSVVWSSTIPSGALGIVSNPASGELYVFGGGPSNGTVTVINETSGAIVSTVPVGGYPEAAAVDPSTDDIYVANFGSDNVSIVSGSTNTVIGTVGVPGTPTTILADKVTGNVFVGSTEFNQSREPQFFNGTVTVISGRSLSRVGSSFFGDSFQGVCTDTPPGPLCMTPGNLTLLNGTTGVPVEMIPVPESSYIASYDAVNGRVYVTSFYPGLVTILASIPPAPTSASPTLSWALPGYDGYVVSVVVCVVAGSLCLEISRRHRV